MVRIYHHKLYTLFAHELPKIKPVMTGWLYSYQYLFKSTFLHAVYEVDSAHTVMAVERCGDYRYDFTDGTHQIVPAETFEDAEWSLRLLMEGEKRMEHNLSKTAAKFEPVPLVFRGRTDLCRTDQRHHADIPAARSW